MHEEPQIPNFVDGKSSPRLRPGMTLAIEPMVNAGLPAVKILNDGWTVVTPDGSISAHFEHTVLVTETEPEILTCPERMPYRSRVIVAEGAAERDVSGGTAEWSPGDRVCCGTRCGWNRPMLGDQVRG